jgi:twitching motility protein PilI
MTARIPDRVSLREYQLGLSERLQSAEAGARVPSKLGLQVGGEGWLVELKDAGEVIPVPPISPVRLARPWFKGVANVRGNLYSVTDFPAFLGGEAVPASEHSRLLLISERFRSGAALLVERSLGLRNAEELQLQPSESKSPWVRGHYVDAQGRSWKELDVAALIQDPAFLEVSS